MKKIAFFDTKPYDRETFDRFNNGRYDIRYFETRLTEAALPLANGCDAVCAFVNAEIDRAVVEGLTAQGIKVLAMRCAGYNNVDFKAAYESGLTVVRVPAYSPYAVAEHAVALLLTLNRHIHKAAARTRDFNFSLAGLTGVDLHGKTAGIVGLGRIGRIFADICNGFGMRVLAFDANPREEPKIEYVAMEKLLAEADVISLHCPLTPETYHLVNEQTIRQMKKGVVILNTSRGALIDAEALLAGIKERKIGAACLDVYEEEADVFFEDRSGHILNDELLARLISMPNVIVTSHQAFLTEEALNNIAETTVNNIRSFFDKDGLCDNELCYRCGNIEQCKKQRKGKCF